MKYLEAPMHKGEDLENAQNFAKSYQLELTTYCIRKPEKKRQAWIKLAMPDALFGSFTTWQQRQQKK